MYELAENELQKLRDSTASSSANSTKIHALKGIQGIKNNKTLARIMETVFIIIP